MNISKKIDYSFTVIMLVFIAVFAVCNAQNFVKSLSSNISSVSAKEITFKEAFLNTDESFRSDIRFKDAFVNLFGLYQRAIGRTVVGNYEFALDNEGTLHAINDLDYNDGTAFANEIVELNNRLRERNIPFYYVQSPSREVFMQDSCFSEMNKSIEIENNILTILNSNDVEVLDLSEVILNEELPFPRSELYLHTDLHMQTHSEIWMARKVAEFLLDEGFEVNNLEYLSDMSLYDLRTYNMYGNYIRTNGDYYIEPDSFEIYYPRFETSYQSYVFANDSLARSGPFETVVLNGYENDDYDEDTYWVTNFGNFMKPWYGYTNNMQDGARVLIVCDSVEYRAFSYLSTTVGEVSILDSRFFGGEIDFVDIALQYNYDVVIVWQATFLLDSPYLVP